MNKTQKAEVKKLLIEALTQINIGDFVIDNQNKEVGKGEVMNIIKNPSKSSDKLYVVKFEGGIRNYARTFTVNNSINLEKA